MIQLTFCQTINKILPFTIQLLIVKFDKNIDYDWLFLQIYTFWQTYDPGVSGSNDTNCLFGI